MAGAKTKQHSGASLHERYAETANKAVQSAAKDVGKEALKVGKDIGKDFITSLLGIDTGHKSAAKTEQKPHHEAKPLPGATIDIVSFLTGGATTVEKHNEKKDKPRIEAAMNYSSDVLRNSERASRHEMSEMNQSIREIQNELKQLLNSSKVLQAEFNEVAVEQAPAEVGKYHMNFFEWMLLVIKQAREKVEDSGAWLSTVKGKNAKKDYWGMFQKHGTTFGLSNERSVATQTG